MYMRGQRPRSIAVSATIVVSLSVLSAGCAEGSHTARTSSTASPGKATATTEPSADSSASTPASQPPSSPSTEATEPSPEPLKDGSAVLVSCASPSDPRATVKITNPNRRDGVFTVKIAFLDAQGFKMVETRDGVSVPAKETTTYRVRVTTAGVVDRIDRCVVEPRAAAAG